MVMSTETDQLKLRKIMPRQIMTKLGRIMFLAISTPPIRMGRLTWTWRYVIDNVDTVDIM